MTVDLAVLSAKLMKLSYQVNRPNSRAIVKSLNSIAYTAEPINLTINHNVSTVRPRKLLGGEI